LSTIRRRWREYITGAGRSPVGETLDALSDDAYAEVAAAMRDVRVNGLVAARHLRDDIYEVRASHQRVEYRLLFATEGRRSQILLGLDAFEKKTRKTPDHMIDRALDRLRDWRERGRRKRAARDGT
jgi:phage-related protein